MMFKLSVVFQSSSAAEPDQDGADMVWVRTEPGSYCNSRRFIQSESGTPSFSRATGSVTLALFLTVPCLCGITSPRSRRPVSFIFDGSERSDTYLTRTVDVVLHGYPCMCVHPNEDRLLQRTTLNYQTLRSRHYNEFFTLPSASLSVLEHETMSQEP